MKFAKPLIFILFLISICLLVMNVGFAKDNITFEEHDFDSYFKMKIPKGIIFEKKEGIPSKNINRTINYKNETKNINIVYTESIGAKEDLLKYYEEIAENDKNISLNTTNNTTLIHFNGENIIGETNYHDLAIIGNNDRYILMQCDNESIMKSMANSVKFK